MTARASSIRTGDGSSDTAPRGGASTGGLARAAPLAARDLAYALLFLLALVSAFLAVRAGIRDDTIGFDFRGTLWDAARAIRDGRSPYPPPVESEIEIGNPALYPPFLMLLVAPLTALPWWLGMTLWTAIQVAAIAGALVVLGARDPRCYALALLSIPVIGGLTCRPDDVPFASWVWNHSPPGSWPALGHAVLAGGLVAAVVWSSRALPRAGSAGR